MRILLCGSWRWEVHEPAISNALARLGATVLPFSWEAHVPPRVARFMLPFQLQGLQRRIFDTAKKLQPDAIFFYRPTPILPRLLRELRLLRSGMPLLSFCNDDPFSPAARRLPWRHFRSSIPLYDANFVYRPNNVGEFAAAGSRRTILLPPFYAPELHFPASLTDPPPTATSRVDVLFVGHYEADGRLQTLRRLQDLGLRVQVHGGGWRHILPALLLKKMPRTPAQLSPSEYRAAVRDATVSLCFLSRLNRDVYTRRVFEIPAMNGCLVSQKSLFLQRLFRHCPPILYSTFDELQVLIRHSMQDERYRERIVLTTKAAVTDGHHDSTSRMKKLFESLPAMTGLPQIPQNLSHDAELPL